MPAWLTTILVAGALLGGGYAAYRYLLPSARGQAATAPVALETPVTSRAVSASPHPLARFIELTGFRISEDAKKRPQIKALLVNHSAADIADLGLDVVVRTADAKPGAEPVCSFAVKLAALGPLEAREITTPLKTHLRAYELPDWQFLKAEFIITSPPAPK